VLTSFRAHPLMHANGFLLATVPVEQADAPAGRNAPARLLARQLAQPFTSG
jgi:hypothetical protein